MGINNNLLEKARGLMIAGDNGVKLDSCFVRLAKRPFFEGEHDGELPVELRERERVEVF